jgi:hypothetical protein
MAKKENKKKMAMVMITTHNIVKVKALRKKPNKNE